MKPTKSAVSYMTTAIYELPYEGAKEMLLVENVDSKEYLAGLFKQCMMNCRFINQTIKRNLWILCNCGVVKFDTAATEKEKKNEQI